MYTTQHNNTLIEHTHNYTYKMDTATAAAITLTHHISSLGTVSQLAVFITPVNWPAVHDKLFQSHQLLNQPLTLPTASLVYSLKLPHITRCHIMWCHETQPLSCLLHPQTKSLIISIAVNHTLTLLKYTRLHNIHTQYISHIITLHIYTQTQQISSCMMVNHTFPS